jgi:hypothetical protein
MAVLNTWLTSSGHGRYPLYREQALGQGGLGQFVVTLNITPITEAMWRQLPAELRARLRRRLGRKTAVLDHQVLDVAKALCHRAAYELAFDLYQALDGQPLIPYQGCGLGLLMNLRELMGEDPAPIGEMLLIQR